jgi:ferritin-like metal-binding protein YciE
MFVMAAVSPTRVARNTRFAIDLQSLSVYRRRAVEQHAGQRKGLDTETRETVELNSLTDVLVEELADLYSAEQQLVEALPALAAATHAYELREAIEAHLGETENHVRRLEEAFGDLGFKTVPAQTCKAMRGLIQEANDTIKAKGDPVAIDAALIGAAQRVEHYEIAGYGTARALAGELSLSEVSGLLDQTLEEEARADKQLTKIAAGGLLSSGINRLAAVRDTTEDAE